MKNLILAAMTCLLSLSAMGTDIQVGKDGMTLEEALRQAREWRRLNAPEAQTPIHIRLNDNPIRLNKPLFIRPEDSGTTLCPTVIHGGVLKGSLSVNQWREENGLWIAEAPMNGPQIIYTRQLWMNGQKAQRAQGPMVRMLNFSSENRTIAIPTSALPKAIAQRFSSSHENPSCRQMEAFVHQRWAIAMLRIKNIRIDGQQAILSFHNPESQLEFDHPWPQPVIGGDRGNSALCLVNAFELLDEPGEWFQDYPSGRLFYKPRAGETIAEVNAEIPFLETLVEVCGSPQRPVHNIIFDGTRFEGSAWYRPSHEGHVTLQGGFRLIDAYKLKEPGLWHKAALENQAWIARPEAAVSIIHAHDISFNKCQFKHLSATALDMAHDVHHSSVTASRFEDIGGTAIMVGDFGENGFETHIPLVATQDVSSSTTAATTPAPLCDNVSIKLCTIHNATNEDWGATGIAAGYVSNIQIVQNTVSHVNYSGICVGWGWTALESGMHHNQIVGNHVSDYARQLYDAGGIYTLSYQPHSVIEGNTISAPSAAPFATNDRAFAIYFDEATNGFTVSNNRMDSTCIGWNQPGKDMILKNNHP